MATSWHAHQSQKGCPRAQTILTLSGSHRRTAIFKSGLQIFYETPPVKGSPALRARALYGFAEASVSGFARPTNPRKGAAHQTILTLSGSQRRTAIFKEGLQIFMNRHP
jgi:hypothetical protein